MSVFSTARELLWDVRNRPDRDTGLRVPVGMIWRAALITAVTVLAFLFARHALATTFKMYDDEGYILLSLDHYLRGGRLYTEVFSQYGPLQFFVQGAVFRLLQLPVTHDSGRLVTLIFWLASAGLGAFFVYRISRDPVLSSAALLACAVLVGDMSFEPGHPQQLILLILAASCCASVGQRGLFLLGGLGAALCFIKINVGVFYLAALALTLICRVPRGRLRSAALGVALLYAVAFPFILMRLHLPGQAAGFCILASVTGAATFLIASLTTPPAQRPYSDIIQTAAGLAVAAAVVVAEAQRERIPWAALLDGVIRDPLRHPAVYAVVLEVPLVRAILALALAGIALELHRRRDQWLHRLEWLQAAQCLVGLIAIPLVSLSAKNCTWLLPFLPLSLIRARELPASDCLPRVFVTCLAATQFLQIYPVAGTQVAIASLPLVLWAFVCVHDGAAGLFRVLRTAAPRLGTRVLGIPVLGSVLCIVLATTITASGACSTDYPYPSSGLRGATSLHLPPDRAAGYRFLASGIRDNCDLLFTLPGMGSFNFWSGVPAPNGMNLTAWVKVLSKERQQAILDILRDHPRACAVYSDEMAHGWKDSTQDLEKSRLAHFVLREMPKVAESLGYEIRVHPHRDAPWANAAQTPETAAGGRP